MPSDMPPKEAPASVPPFTQNLGIFEPSNLKVQSTMQVLIVGAGKLATELLSELAL